MNLFAKAGALAVATTLFAAAIPASADTHDRRRAENAPLVIGHRGGATGYAAGA